MTVQSTPDHAHPVPGYYPDPSIPGFVRYWDGDAWTPGSARRAPAEGEVLPPPKNARPPRPRPQEETGPVFLDETGAASLWSAREHAPAAALTWGVEQPRTEPPAVAGLPAREPGGAWPELRPESEVGPESEPTPGRPLPSWLAEQTGDWSDAAVFGRGVGAEGGRSQLAAGTGEFAAPEALRRQTAGGVGAAAEPTDSAAQPPLLGRESAEGPGGELPGGRRSTRSGGASAPAGAGGLGAGTLSPAGEFAAGGSTPRRREVPDVGPSVPESAAAASAQAAPAQGQVPPPARESEPGPRVAPSAAPAGTGDTAGAGPAGAGVKAGAALSEAGVTPGASARQRRAAVRDAERQGAGAAARKGVAVGPGGAALDAAAAAVGAARPARGARAGALPPAPAWRRVAARAVDLVLTLGAATALAGVPLAQGVVTHLQDKVDAARLSGLPQRVWFVDPTVLGSVGALLAVVFGLGLVFEAVPTALRGRTLGKALFGLRVLDARSRARPGLGRAVGRLFSTTLLLGLGRDRIGRTRVVRAVRNAGRQQAR